MAKILRGNWGLLLLLVVMVSGVGCKSLKTGAKEEFSAHFSCPEDRITVSERPYSAIAGNSPSPPREVASDPERLAIWKKQQDEKAAALARNYEAFEVEGCGRKVLYRCSHVSQRGGHSAG